MGVGLRYRNGAWLLYSVTNFMCWFQLSELGLGPVLHEHTCKHGEVEFVSDDTDHLPQEAPQGTQVVLLAREEVLEYTTEQLPPSGER